MKASVPLSLPLDSYQDSARSAAMGSAFVGLADDSTALLSNPAGLAGLDQDEAALHHNQWLVDTSEDQGVLALPFGPMGTLGAGLDYINFGSFGGRDALGNPLASYSASRAELQGAWGLGLPFGLSLGAGLRGVYDSLATVHDSSVAGDVGLLWRPLAPLRMGFAVVNLGSPVAGSDQAAAVRVGESYCWDLGGGRTWLATAETSVEPGAINRVQIGTEGTVFKLLAVRAGYVLGLKDSELGGQSGWTAGFGLHYASMQVDYAYLPFGELGNSQRISLSYRFGPSQSALLAAAQAQAPRQSVPAQAAPGPNDLQLKFSLPPDSLTEGRTLEEQGKPYEAIRAYQEALKRNSRDEQAWRALGALYYKLGKTAFAIQCFEQVLEIRPDDAATRQWLTQMQGAKNSR